jgi:prepilin-type N-terminal cleavage/methylation domain-containing protein
MLNKYLRSKMIKKDNVKIYKTISKDSSEYGFSMVEIMVSLVVLSMLVGVMFTIVTNSSSLNAKTALRAEAGALAFAKIQDYINLSFNNIPIGDDVNAYEVEDFSSEAQALKLSNASAKVYIEPESELPSGSTPTITNYSQSISADSTFASGSEINSIDVDDAIGAYWRRDRISDDSFSNYTYNEDSPGANNKPLPSIDLGSAQDVDTIRIEWWTCTYGANNFRIEAKNSSPNTNSGWTTIRAGLADNGIPCSSSASAAQDIDVSSNSTPYRYWRMYVVEGTHPLWNVISEFEAFSSGTPGDIVEQQGSDATDNPGELFFSSSDLEMSDNGVSGQQSIGIIFDDVDTPQGATITNSYIEFTADENDSGAVSLLVTGVDTNNAQPWTTSFAVDNAVDNDSSDGLIGTNATTSWSPPAWTAGEVGSDTTVDVTSIVQEIVNRGGWISNNDLAFAVQYQSGSGKRVAERLPSPRLVIEWSETTNISSSSDYVDADGDGDVDNPNLLRVTTVIEYDTFGTRQRVEYSSYVRKFGVSD